MRLKSTHPEDAFESVFLPYFYFLLNLHTNFSSFCFITVFGHAQSPTHHLFSRCDIIRCHSCINCRFSTNRRNSQVHVQQQINEHAN